jgi:hypothetical protein
VHRNKPAIEASLKVVNVAGILDQKHGNVTVNVNGRKEKRCSIFQSMTCEEHFKIADYAFLNGFASSTGQVFVCVFNSYAKRPTKPVQNPGGEGYVKIVEEALKKIDGYTISKWDYDAFMAQMDAGKAAEAKDLHKAVEIYVKASKNEQARLAALALTRVQELDQQGAAIVADAEKLAAQDPGKAKEALRKVIREYAPLECSKKAAEVLKLISEKGK